MKKPRPIYFRSGDHVLGHYKILYVWGKHSLAPGDILQVLRSGERVRITEARQITPQQWQVYVTRGFEGTVAAGILPRDKLLLAQKEKEAKP